LLTLREMPINPFLWHVENARKRGWGWGFPGKTRGESDCQQQHSSGAAVKTTTHLYFLVSSSDLLCSACCGPWLL